MAILQTILFIPAAFGIIYALLSLLVAVRFASRRVDGIRTDFTPPVSILKPLCGLDPNGYESLRSHCLQDYPEYEIIFGVSTSADPAAAAVERLIQEFPNIPMRLVVCSNVFG